MREIIYGRNAVLEALRAGRRQYFGLKIAEGARSTDRIEQILAAASGHGIPVARVPRATLDSAGVNHQGVALEVGEYPYCDLADILERPRRDGVSPFVLILDTLQDPQNLGSLLRTAEGTGVDGVLIPLARSVDVTPAVVSASAGASEHLWIARLNLAQAMDALKSAGMWIVGLDQRGEPFGPGHTRHLQGPLGLVVGSEGEGLRELTRRKCDLVLRLPMQGRVESLNAAVAGSVVLYLAHMARQEQLQRA